jgi:transcriptional regulator GlxA family with amidase domain
VADTSKLTLGGTARAPVRIGFLLVPGFSLMAMTSALEPLRLANRVVEDGLYDIKLYSLDGDGVESSAGITITPDASFTEARDLDVVVVTSGLIETKAPETVKPIIATLRRLAKHGVTIGAVCTGARLLAMAGLVDGYRVTTHWEYQPVLANEFPDLEITQELFEIDRSRFTCAGGTAGVDLMLSMVARDYGEDIASAVTDQLVHHRIREAGERQRMDLRSRLGVSHPKVLYVVARMEETIEAPVSCAALAQQAGVSIRQLERLFAKYMGHSPNKHYLMVRLRHARHLLQQTGMPILSVALACGFVSASHFTKSYNEFFGRTPSAERKRLSGGNPSATRGRSSGGPVTPSSVRPAGVAAKPT